MAIGVTEAMQYILRECMGSSNTAAQTDPCSEDALVMIKNEGRYHEDIYSILV